MTQIAINTSQNVNIDFTLASVGDRIAAYIIDIFIKVAYLLTVSLLLFKVFDFGAYLDSLDNWSVAAIIGIITLPANIYTLVLETMMEGQTFGKKIMKIRVVKIDGYQASFGDYLIRWLVGFFEIYITSGIVALITIIISKNNQRLGGIASGTAVISLKNNVNISHTILENLQSDYVPKFPQVIAFSDNDMRIIKENYQKAARIDDQQIIHKLSEKIKEIIKTDYSQKDFTERQFINTIIKDYNFYTGKDA